MTVKLLLTWIATCAIAMAVMTGCDQAPVAPIGVNAEVVTFPAAVDSSSVVASPEFYYTKARLSAEAPTITVRFASATARSVIVTVSSLDGAAGRFAVLARSADARIIGEAYVAGGTVAIPFAPGADEFVEVTMLGGTEFAGAFSMEVLR